MRNTLLLLITLKCIVATGQIESEEIFPEDYSNIYHEKTNGQFSISKTNNKYGVYHNEKKIFIIPPSYDRIRFSSGKEISFIATFSELENYTTTVFNQKTTSTRKVNKEVLINTKNEIVSKKYASIDLFQDNQLAIASFSKDTIDYEVFIDTNGKEVSDTYVYIDYNPILKLYCVKEKDGKAGIVSDNLKTVIPFEYDNIEIRRYDNSTIVVKKDNMYGVVNLKNEIVVPIIYQEIKGHFDDKYIVVKDKKQILINQKNELVFNVSYDRIYNPDTNGNYIVKDNRKYGVVSNSGQLLIPIECKKIYSREILGYYVTQKNKLFGLYNKRGELLIPIEYDFLALLIEDETLLKSIDYKTINRFIAVKNGKCGIIDMNNTTIIPFEYKFIKFAGHTNDFKKKVKSSNIKREDYLYQVFIDEENHYIVNDMNAKVKTK
ncbi:WG repeat-containing protein [Aquimarina sp. D1M17]|uniref:WG repeat-containing protein n=1 Tax=Aquimarina acroporae TaxID=2937283 RepID=UPI0020BFCB50|nr:WG repeat-containing protein [Aquimarina acroporae]MCK8521463.1 WG repeat-containing protein [Aquimarina acroporae]